MCTQTRTWPSSRRAEMASSKSLASSGSIVKVGSAGEVHAGVRRVGLRRRALGLGRGRARVARCRPRSSIRPSSTSRAPSGRPSRRTTRAPRLPEPTSTRSPAPAPPRSTAVRGPGPNSGSATRKRPRFSSTATSGWSRRGPGGPDGRAHRRSSRASSATGSASSRSVSGLSTARTCGLMPPGGDRLPAGQVVVGDGEVEEAAVRERLDLLHEALAERARADHRGAIAVAQRAGDDLGGAGAAAVHEHDHRDVLVDRVALGVQRALGRGRPRTETILPSSMKMLETSTASESRPPPLPRRSSTIASAPWPSTWSISRRSTPCARS